MTNTTTNNSDSNDYDNPFPLPHKHNQMCLKFVLSFLLLGIAYHFYFNNVSQSSPILESDTDFLIDNTFRQQPPPPVVQPREASHLPVDGRNGSRASNSARCDLFTGEWVPDPTAPFYTNNSCQTIEEHQNCMRNGRPDSGYVYWRWSPRGCKLPKFDPEIFLGLTRDKSMAFIGDSISRNHVHSLLCILSQVEKPVAVYHDKEYRSRRWLFPSYNFTLSVIWSPFLVKASIFEDFDGVASNTAKLNLDEPDPVWADQYKNFDYIEIGGGKWFLKTAVYYENHTIQGCHNCPQNNISKVGFQFAYRKAINLALKLITNSKHEVFTFFRTATPDHFENGEWNTGGYCNRTVPFKEGEVDLVDVDQAMHDIDLEEFEKAVDLRSEKGLGLRLFDTTHLSLLRPDGHPGPYRTYHPFSGKYKNAKVQLDCLHWCLPGPIDTWNDLMMEMMLNG